MIETVTATKRFGNMLALDGFTTQIPRGSIYGLIGSNGSGKSTLLRLISGVYRPDAGEVKVDGAPVFENEALKGRIFFVSDEFYYFPQSTLEEMARFYEGIYPGFTWERYQKIAALFPISRQQKIQTFSKGMQRQAALILGLSAQADCLLLDEAFDGLDPILRSALRRLLADDVASRATTVLITSHNLRELEDMCDRVGLLHGGKLLFQEEIDALKLGFCKVQAAFRPIPDEKELRGLLDILQLQVQGSLLHLVVRGNSEQALEALQQFHPLFSESLPLTLEEVFINEMEAIGYDYNNVLF